MASGVHVVLVDEPRDARSLVWERLQELEERWSRFLPGSDVTRLNSAPGVWTSVSDDTLVLLSAMKQGWRLSGRRYDPTLLAPLLTAGYSRSVDGSGRISTMPEPSGPPRASIEDVTVDPAARSAQVPVGIGIDPGGIGKGLAADLLVGELLAAGCGGALVSIGGDLAAGGTPPSAAGWYVAVADPLDAERTILTFTVTAGGVATSSTVSRTWLHAGRRQHHLLDPATRAPARTDLAAATVVAATAWEAEAHATAAILLGSKGFRGYLDEHELSGVAIAKSGVILATPDLVLDEAVSGRVS